MKRPWAGRSVVVLGLVIGLPAMASAYDAKGRRDPFVPLLTTAGTLREPPAAVSPTASAGGPLRLEGIVHDPNGPSVAIINGTIWRVGDVRDEVEVVAIEPSSVVVRHRGVQDTLRLPVPDADAAAAGVTGGSS